MTTPTPTPPLDAFSHTDATAWVEHYLEAQLILLATDTIATYRQKLQQFLDWWHDHAPEAPYTARPSHFNTFEPLYPTEGVCGLSASRDNTFRLEIAR